jgi:predicted DNA binding CopG/RHH family protein
MNDRLKVPKFASEEAARSGRLRRDSTALRRARETSNSLTIHLSDSDLAAIRNLAAQRGQDEDACVAAILHRALENETPDHGIDRH